jgi:ABC-2 type transport system permease protein
LEFYLSGEAVALKRLVLAATTLDLVRQVEGKPVPLSIVTRESGGKRPSTLNLIVLFMTLYVTVTGGVFVPALQFLEGREQGTLRAFLVTPGRISEVLIARAVSGLLMALVLSFVALAVNLELPRGPGVILLPLAVSAILFTEIGLVLGLVLKDSRAAGGIALALQDLKVEMAVGLGLAAVLAVIIVLFGRRMETRLAAE